MSCTALVPVCSGVYLWPLKVPSLLLALHKTQKSLRFFRGLLCFHRKDLAMAIWFFPLEACFCLSFWPFFL